MFLTRESCKTFFAFGPRKRGLELFYKSFTFLIYTIREVFLNLKNVINPVSGVRGTIRQSLQCSRFLRLLQKKNYDEIMLIFPVERKAEKGEEEKGDREKKRGEERR